ncbi:MAG: MerR family DNA-binding transcriptional regulator [Solirubrobacteraceae bacterium]
MRYLKTTEAAALLDVGPSTLRAWERRFGFPNPQRSASGHRAYPHGEIAALRAALEQGPRSPRPLLALVQRWWPTPVRWSAPCSPTTTSTLIAQSK